MTTRAGFIAIVGAPNAGKSTLLNALLGQKLAIATPKAQTTRINLKGVLTSNNNQFIFVDTPGICKQNKELDRRIVVEAQQALAEADVILLVVDALKGLEGETAHILRALEHIRRPLLLALNKVDKIADKTRLLPLLEKAGNMRIFKEIFPISALKKKGVEALLTHLAPYLPESPHLYGEEALTDMPMRLLAAEITREKAFLLLHQEIPYGLMVETVSYEINEKQHAVIHQNIVINREGYKKIVLGTGGERLKKIGQWARADLEALTGGRVHLYLKVKVRKGWESDPSLLQSAGLAHD